MGTPTGKPRPAVGSLVELAEPDASFPSGTRGIVEEHHPQVAVVRLGDGAVTTRMAIVPYRKLVEVAELGSARGS